MKRKIKCLWTTCFSFDRSDMQTHIDSKMRVNINVRWTSLCVPHRSVKFQFCSVCCMVYTFWSNAISCVKKKRWRLKMKEREMMLLLLLLLPWLLSAWCKVNKTNVENIYREPTNRDTGIMWSIFVCGTKQNFRDPENQL